MSKKTHTLFLPKVLWSILLLIIMLIPAVSVAAAEGKLGAAPDRQFHSMHLPPTPIPEPTEPPEETPTPVDTNCPALAPSKPAYQSGVYQIVTVPEIADLSWSSKQCLAIAAGFSKKTVVMTPAGAVRQNYQPYIDPNKTSFHDRVAWSADGKKVASYVGIIFAKNQIHLWDVTTGIREKVFYTGVDDIVSEIAWSPNGKYIAASFHDRIYVWNTQTGSARVTIPGGIRQDIVMAWSPDSTYLAYGGYGSFAVTLWDVEGGFYTGYTGHANDPVQGPLPEIQQIAWSSNGQYVVSASSTKVNLWAPNWGGGNTIRTFDYTQQNGTYTTHFNDIAWSPNNQHFALSFIAVGPGGYSSYDGMHVLNLDGQRLADYRVNETYRSSTGIDWSPDGNFIATRDLSHILYWVAP